MSPEDTTAPTTWGSDAPLTDPSEDRFRRWPFAQHVARTLARQHDPSSLVVAIYGVWGDGKTTVLNYIRRALEEEGAIPVWFNPWRFRDEDMLLVRFFDELGKAMELRLRPA